MSPATITRTLPHNSEAEKTTIGALLLDPSAMNKVAGTLNTADFFDPTYRAIFAAIADQHELGTAFDFVTVSNALSEHKQFQAAGGSAFLAEIVASVPTASHIDVYAKLVRGDSVKRHVAMLGQQMAATAVDPEKTSLEVIETAEQGILALSRGSSESTTFDLADLHTERFDHYVAVYEAEDKAALFGLTTGFPDLDRLITGLPASDLIVVAARPSMGKTALALDMARHVVNRLEKKVLFISLEMSKEQLVDRWMAGALGVSTHDLRKGYLDEEHFEQMGPAFDAIPKDRFFIDDDFDSTLTHLRSKARQQQMEHGLDLLIVDYLQLLEVGGKTAPENRVQEVSKISRALKQLARELRVPVIALSQLSRNLEHRNDKRPRLADLRESGSIEQDADTVLMLHRDDDVDAEPGLTELYVRKQRQGPTGMLELRFNKRQMQFESVAGEETEARQEELAMVKSD